MGNISNTDVEKVAELARLELTEAEKELYGGQLGHILDYVDQLQEVATEGIPLTASVALPETILREDVVRAGLSVGEAVANAPETREGFFVVPKILEK